MDVENFPGVLEASRPSAEGLVDPPRNPVGSFLQATGPGLVARMRRQAAAFNATMVSDAAVRVDVSRSPFTITLDEAEAQTTADGVDSPNDSPTGRAPNSTLG